MQDIQNIPNPDINQMDYDDDFGNHSAANDARRENEAEQTSEETPVPPDTRPSAPIEEPPETDAPAIDEDDPDRATRIMDNE